MEKAGPANRYHYNAFLGKWAHDLRHRQTRSEMVVWKHALQAGAAHGFKFDRQRPVLQFIADFMCRPLLLIIEIDGLIHSDPAVKLNDELRTGKLEAVGFKVIRYTVDEVYYTTTHVTASIHETVVERALELGVSMQRKPRRPRKKVDRGAG